jgi:hypothetical protein
VRGLKKFFSTSLFLNWQVGTQLPTAQAALAAAFLFSQGYTWQRCDEKVFKKQDGVFIKRRSRKEIPA